MTTIILPYRMKCFLRCQTIVVNLQMNNIVLRSQFLDILRSHRHLCLDCDIVNALFDESAASSLIINPHALTQLLEHIHKTPEIAISLSSQDITVKSHSHTSTTNSSSLSTAITLALDEFETVDRMDKTADSLDLI